jgi:glycosyltransferase involved in cell wall biosynthesis
MKKIKLLIHHHTVAYQNNEGLWLQSFIAEWVMQLSLHFDEIGLLFHSSNEKRLAQDILVKNNKIKLHSLGPPGNYYDVIKKRIRIKKVIKSIKNNYDVFLIRGITPRQSLVSNNIVVNYPKKYYLLVGSQRFDVTTLRLTSVSEVLSNLFKYYRRYQFKKLVRNMKLLVNGHNLIFKKDYIRNPVFIPTNTISEKHYSKKFKKNKNQYIRLLYCGRVEPNKGIVELLNSLKTLNDLGYPTKLDVVGKIESNDFFLEIGRLIEYYNLKNNIIFNGFVKFGEELFNFYRKSDYFVLPSYSEGFPHAIWEAAANYCPIITTDVGGIEHIIKDRQHGILIKPKSSDDIVQSVLELEKNVNLKEKLIKNAYKESMNFTVEKCAKFLSDFIYEDTKLDK